MRFILKIETVWHVEPLMREKIGIASHVLKELERLRLFKIDSFMHGYVEGVYFSDFFSPYRLAVSERMQIQSIARMDLDNMSNYLMKGIEPVLRKERHRMVARGLRLKLSLLGRLFGYPVVCSYIIRGSGREKKDLGDVELSCYNLKLDLNNIVSILQYIMENHGAREVYLNLREAGKSFIRIKHDASSVKEFFVQKPDAKVKSDLDKTFALAHRDVRSHIAFLVKFLKKRREEHTLDREKVVLSKWSTFLNPSTIYNKLWADSDFINKVVNSYSVAGYEVSTGSLIVVPREAHLLSLLSGYLRIIDSVIYPIVEDFPSHEKYEEWLKRGLNRLKTGGTTHL